MSVITGIVKGVEGINPQQNENKLKRLKCTTLPTTLVT